MSNKLQVIDSTKLNDLLNAFEKDRREKKLLEGILDPKLLQLRETYDKMNNKRNKDIYEKEADVVNFLSKSKKYKDSKNIAVPAPLPSRPRSRFSPLESSRDSTRQMRSFLDSLNLRR